MVGCPQDVGPQEGFGEKGMQIPDNSSARTWLALSPHTVVFFVLREGQDFFPQQPLQVLSPFPEVLEK